MERSILLIRSLILLTLLPFLTALAQKPELVVQTGHTSNVSSVAFSPDGLIIASGSGDNTIILWDAKTGAQLRTLKGHRAQVTSVAISPDGTTLASSSLDNTVRVWNIASGTKLLELAHKTPVYSTMFSPDGNTLASGAADDNIRIWNVKRGELVRTLQQPNRLNLRFPLAFSPDGMVLASGGQDKISLWNVSSGSVSRTLDGHTQPVVSVAFSPDGKRMVSVDYDGLVKVWDMDRNLPLFTQNGFSNEVDTIFSPDGKLVAGRYVKDEGTIKLLNSATGLEVRTFKVLYPYCTSLAFSPNGKILVSGDDLGNVRLWDVAYGKEMRTLISYSPNISAFAFNRNGKTLASTQGANVKLWDVSGYGALRTLKGHRNNVDVLAFSPDGKTLASNSFGERQIKLWDSATGAELLTIKSSDLPLSIAFSPDGKTLASGGFMDRLIEVWDVHTGVALRTLRGHTGPVHSLAFSSDSSLLASGGRDDTVRLWDYVNGVELRTLQAANSSEVKFSPDGTKLLYQSDYHNLKLLNLKNGYEQDLPQWIATSLSFSSDGRLLACGSGDEIVIWDIVRNTKISTLSGHGSWVISGSFSPDNKVLANGSTDGTIKLWDVTRGIELASLAAIGANDWAVVTPDGLFDGTPDSWSKMIWRSPVNTLDYAPVEAYFNEFFRPGLLAEVMAGKRPLPAQSLSQKDRRAPQLKLLLAGEQASDTRTVVRTVKVQITLSEPPADKTHKTGSGTKDVRLFRNGSLVKLWRGDTFAKESKCQQLPAQAEDASTRRRSVCAVAVPIVAGENRLTAYAFNSDNVKSSDATLTISGADTLRRKGVAYVLAVGVNQYANAHYNLKYALPDAQDFAEELKRQQTKLGNYERVEVMSLSDKEATKDNILKLLTDLPAKVQPEDAVVIYFAGHGTAQGNRFYLIPHDLGYTGNPRNLNAAALQTILKHSISDEELEGAIENIDAGQLLLVIDACNSGQALEAEEKRRGPMNSKGLAQLAYEKGMYILTAAQSYQAALEATKLGHGYLTYALVEEGLKTKAAYVRPEDNQLLLREWLDYATNRVPQMQQETIERGARGLGLEVIFVEGDEKIKDPRKRSLQRPRVFYRRETEMTPMVIAKP